MEAATLHRDLAVSGAGAVRRGRRLSGTGLYRSAHWRSVVLAALLKDRPDGLTDQRSVGGAALQSGIET
jgi:hypothetical protein